MYKKPALTLLCCICTLYINAQPVSIVDFGAVNDGVTLNTKAIQKAIDTQAESGGGTVIIPTGVFISGTINLRSNITLHLENGATLRGSANLEDYDIYANGNQLGLIFSEDIENVVISGSGTIDGNGRAYVYPNRVKDLWHELKQYTRQGDAYLDTLKGIQDGPVVPFEHERPYQMLLFSGVKNLTITGVTIKDSPFWAVHVADSDGIIVQGVRVRNSLLMANADGLNFTSSSNIVISDCDIIAGDDALAFSGYSVHHEIPGYRDIRRVSENVSVSNCIIQTRSSGIRVGGLSQNDIRNYRFDNITIYDSNRGIGVFLNMDGSVENIHFSNMTIQTRLHTGDWWGNGEPIHISVVEGGPIEKELGIARNITFNNIDISSETGVLVYSDKPDALQDVYFKNVNIKIKNGKLQDEYGGNFDLRPTVEISKNLFAHDIPGIYVRNAKNVTFNEVFTNWENNMHPNFLYGAWIENSENVRFFDSEITAPSQDQKIFNVVNTKGFQNLERGER